MHVPVQHRWGPVSVAMLVLAVFLGPATAHAQATPSQPPSPAGDCTIVFGQGRNFSDTTPQTNQAWNSVNRVFNTQVVVALSAASNRAVQLVLPVEATDLQANVNALLERTDREGCNRVLETAVFANPDADLLVARIRSYPIVRIVRPGASAPDGTVPGIGTASYTNQRDFALTQRNLDRLDPEALAHDLVQGFIQAQGR